MAVRGSSNYYHIDQIQRRHWSNHARQVGLGTVAAEAMIDEVLADATGVIDTVAALLPKDFPLDVAEAIFQGLLRQCQRLRGMNR